VDTRRRRSNVRSESSGDVRPFSAVLPRASDYQIETGARECAVEKGINGSDQRRRSGPKRRRRKGDDRSRTASSVLTGAVRSSARTRERERERESGREERVGENDRADEEGEKERMAREVR